MLSGLQTESRLAPRSARTRTADRCLSFTASMRMIVRVHNGTADGRTNAHMTDSSCFSVIDKVVVAVADNTDRCSAVQADHSHLSGGKTQGRVLAFLRHQLGAVAGRADHLAAVLRIKLNIVNHGTNRNQVQRQAVAHADLSLRAVHDSHADCEPFRCKDVGLLSVCVADQRDVRGSVRIIFDRGYLCRNVVLISLEIDDSVLSSVSAASVANGDLALVVSSVWTVYMVYKS